LVPEPEPQITQHIFDAHPFAAYAADCDCVFRRKWAMIPVQNGQAHRDYLWGSRSEATLAF
jgi:hypothetical protein